MAAPPPPIPPGKEEFDGAGEIFEPVKQFLDVKKFLKTRQAILEGEPLYKSTKSDLTVAGYMNPWKFNVMQSTICSIPGVIIAGLTSLFLVSSPIAVVKAVQDPVQQKILSTLLPLKPPFILLLSVYVIALCSLPPGFVTKPNWDAAKRKYLYLDAAYGIWPQLILATCVALMGLLPSLIAVISLAWLGTLIWQSIITAFKIREGMFEFDYLAESETMFQPLKERPFFRFYVCSVIGLIILIPLFDLLLVTVSHLLAMLVHSVRAS
jgi:hypothetical protein